MATVEPRILRGFRDYLPREMISRQEMLAAVERVFHRYGYLPLMTPALEYSEILLGKYGDEGDQLLYRFRDNGGRDVALRYDLTVPLARAVAQYADFVKPLRRYQVAPVWRAEKPGRGRFREFVQCDGDIVGSAEPLADAEVIQLGADMLEELGVEKFRIRFNNRKVLSGLMGTAGVSRQDEAGVLRTIDKLPKIGEEATRKLLAEENRLEAAPIETIFQFLGISGSCREVLARLADFFDDGSIGKEGWRELEAVHGILEAVGLEDRITLDLSIARGLNYYTGTIYETFLEDLPGFGAVMSGGRYDGLIGVFSRDDVPAVGISLGMDRLLAGLGELGLVAAKLSTASVLVTVFAADTAALSARVARDLRRAGIACELFPQFSKLGKQLRHAERTEKRFAVIVGPDEASRGIAQLKDLAARSQEEVPLDDLARRIRDLESDSGSV